MPNNNVPADAGNQSAKYRNEVARIKGKWYRENAPVEPPKPEKDAVALAREQGARDKLKQQYVLPNPQPAENVPAIQPVEEWDYKTAKTDMAGKVPLSFKLGDWNLEPEGFDPNGELYFGKGLKGWFKKLAYKTLDTAWGDEVNADEQKKVISDGFKKIQDANYKEIATNAKGQDVKELGKVASGAWDVVKGTWGVLESEKFAGDSVAGTVVAKTVNVGVKGVNLAATTVIDAFQILADSTESVLNMNKTMRQYVEEHGGNAPIAEANFDPIMIGKEYAIRDELINTFFRSINPILGAYDSIRFAFSEGTFQQKVDTLKEGWYEGRMLYSELVRPSVEAEFDRRMKEPGANPDLLAMELQDPYAELVGELIFDPLNLIAGEAKAAKFADKVNKAGDLGGVTDKVIDILKVGSEVATDAHVSAAVDEAAKAIIDFGWKKADDGTLVSKAFGRLEYKATSLNARGMVTKQTKNMSEFLTWAAANVKNKGGALGDFSDALGALVKLSSQNADEVKDAMAFLKGSRFVDAPIAFFSQQGLETSHLLRNIMGEGDDVEKLISKLRDADWDTQAKILNDLTTKSVKTAYPTVTEMAEGAKKVAAGTGTTKDIRLSQEYARIAKEHPSLITLAKFDNEISKPWRQINSAFSNIYFTNYGFAARQYLSNAFMVLKEGGAGAYFREGKFKSIGSIREELKAIFPAGLPEVLSQKSIVDSVETGDNFLTAAFKNFKDWKLSPQALAANTEQAAGERVFYKFYRDHMDTVANFGVGLPKIEEFAARGFSPEMAKDFQTIFKAHGYNTAETMKIFNAKYSNGVEMFRDLSWLSEEAQKGLKDYGGLDELVKFVNDPNTKTKEQVSGFIQDLIDDADRKARGTIHDVNGVSKERALDHLDMLGDTKLKEMIGYSELQTHLSNAQNASIEAFRSDLNNASATARKRIQEISQRIAAGEKINPEEATLMKQLNEWLSKSDLHVNQADNMRAENYKKIGEMKRDLDAWLKENKAYKYGDEPRDTKWKEWYAAVDKANEEYFQFYNGGGTKLAEDFGLLTGEDVTKTFEKSRQATVDVQAAKQVVAGKNGGIFHVPPKGYGYTKPGQNGHDLNVRKLAEYFGIKNEPNAILNTINKNAETKFTQLFDVPLEDAQKAFANKTGIPTDVIARWKREGNAVDSTNFMEKLGKGDQRIPAYQQLRDQWDTFTPEQQKEAMHWITGKIAVDPVTGLETVFSKGLETKPAGWHEAMIDANGLGAINDHLGHAAGNTFLKGVGDATNEVTKKYGGRAFRVGGDEITTWFPDQASAEKAMQELDDKFHKSVIQFTAEDGTTYEKTGFSISYGTGTDETAADKALYADKERRISLGQRPAKGSPKGTLPGSIVDAGAGQQPKGIVNPNTVVEDTRGLIPASPIHPGGTTGFSEAQAWKEGQKELTKQLRVIEQGILDRFGRRGEAVTGDKLQALKDFEKSIADKTALAKLTATKVGAGFRDFALHAYGETTNLDHAAQFIFPYQFWYSRTYANFAKSLVTNADMIAGYGKLKDFMASKYKDQPEWYKYNVKFPDFMGINGGNPFMFNLESSIWPLQGITGVDFNDPDKRTNWFTSTVDDLGKFGPSTWTPISMGIAAYYQIRGEKDIAAKWGTRAIPQTATVKAISSYFGNPIELDPNVQIFSGNGLFDFNAADPYEEGRISRALAAMEAEGVPEQQLVEAARTHSGELWDEAYQRAVQQRAPGQIMSALFGVAFRPRTETDMETDKFYADYGRARTLHDGGLMSDEQYKQSFNTLRERYPFMDIILLSRRAGMGRDAAYAYNVISRIPPGMTKEVYGIVGIDPETAQKFYDSGGKLEGMSETEKQRFMAAMVDAGAILAIPSGATRTEWTGAKNQYSAMQGELKKQFGDDIADKMSLYFGINDTKEAKLFLQMHPEVTNALDAQQSYITNNPQLLKYYGGINTIERYYTGIMYDQLEKEFGKEITKTESGYFAIFNPKEKKAYIKAHPELKPYWEAKDALKQQNLRHIVRIGDKLPKPTIETTGNTPENPTQQNLQNFANPQPQPTFEQWRGVIGQPMTELIQEYWYNDQELPTAAKSNLDYLANQYGYDDGDAMLQAILMSLQQ